jgi:hypothetical protein
MYAVGMEVGTKRATIRSKHARRLERAKKGRKGLMMIAPKSRERRRTGKGVIFQQDQALEYFLKGYTYLDISKELGCSNGTAANLVKKGMERFQLTLGLEFKDWQNKHLTQLAKLYGKHIRLAGKSVKSAELCVKIIDLEAEIVGSKKAPMMFVAPPPELEYDVSRLTIAQLKQFRDLLANAKPIDSPQGQVIDGESSPVPLLEHEAQNENSNEDNEAS